MLFTIRVVRDRGNLLMLLRIVRARVLQPVCEMRLWTKEGVDVSQESWSFIVLRDMSVCKNVVVFFSGSALHFRLFYFSSLTLLPSLWIHK